MPDTRNAETSGGWMWPLSFETAGDCSAFEKLDADVSNRFSELAADFLWRWTNRKYGTKTVQVRPVSTLMPELTRRMDRFWGFGPYSVGSSGPLWIRPKKGSLPHSSLRASSIYLPAFIGSLKVRLDGSTMDSSSYTLEDGVLTRTDGGVWPLDQDPYLPASEEGTFEVTYQSGKTVPQGGQVSAGLLACEFAKAAEGDPECGLPQRVQTFTRQGVSVAMLDEFDDLKEGHTGIWLIDSWIASITQTSLRPSVMSPDYRHRPERHRHTSIVQES